MSPSERAVSHLRGVYLLTPDAPPDRFDRTLATIDVALDEGVTAIQYRNKSASREQREAEARRIVDRAHARGAIVIVNDDPDLALRVAADGVHVGRDDMALDLVRALVGDRLIGASCYDSIDTARAAVDAHSDSIAFGSIFTSPTKPHAVAAPLALLTRARALFSRVRVVAIGGIDVSNIASVAAAGAHAAALISAVFAAADPRSAVRQLIDQFLEGQARYDSQRTTV